jgi:hypothetical protein
MIEKLRPIHVLTAATVLSIGTIGCSPGEGDSFSDSLPKGSTVIADLESDQISVGDYQGTPIVLDRAEARQEIMFEVAAWTGTPSDAAGRTGTVSEDRIECELSNLALTGPSHVEGLSTDAGTPVSEILELPISTDGSCSMPSGETCDVAADYTASGTITPDTVVLNMFVPGATHVECD